jgi:uncharacterized membrane protein YfhO
LTDVWYPGWVCEVDGEPAQVYRADYAFRAVGVTAGTHTVVFRFEPASYRRGRLVSLCALGAVAVCVLVLAVLGWLRRGPARHQG